MNTTAAVCTGLLGLLLFGLGLSVSLLRWKFNVLVGHPDEPTHMLHRAVRAHGNTAEYAPFLAVLFLYLGAHQPAAWIVWCIVIATTARFLIVLGILTSATLARPHAVRFMGALGTYVAGLALSVAALMQI